MGSKSQVCEGGSEGMAADSDVQVAQIFAAWLDEKSAQTESPFFFCWGNPPWVGAEE